jgi:hypothetical protein
MPDPYDRPPSLIEAVICFVLHNNSFAKSIFRDWANDNDPPIPSDDQPVITWDKGLIDHRTKVLGDGGSGNKKNEAQNEYFIQAQASYSIHLFLVFAAIACSFFEKHLRK